MTAGSRQSTWIAVAVAAIIVIGVVVVVASFWTEIGDTGMSVGGWIAMLLGVLATLGLGIGLMALVFISSRRGYDEQAGSEAERHRR